MILSKIFVVILASMSALTPFDNTLIHSTYYNILIYISKIHFIHVSIEFYSSNGGNIYELDFLQNYNNCL